MTVGAPCIPTIGTAPVRAHPANSSNCKLKATAWGGSRVESRGSRARENNRDGRAVTFGLQFNKLQPQHNRYQSVAWMSTLPFTSPPDPFDQRRSVPVPGVASSARGDPAAAAGPALGPAAQVDPALIQQTKKELRQIVQEITHLSQSNVAQEQFYEEFLRRVVSALAAEGGAVWIEGEEGQLDLQYQIKYPTRFLAQDRVGQARHGLLLRNVFQSGQPTLVPPQSGANADDEAGNSTEYLLILATLKVEQRTVGVIEIFQRAGGGPTTQRGYLRFLVQMTELAGDFLKNRRLRHLGDRQTLWDSLERFLRVVHRGLNPRATAFAIVNESRPIIQCDRVSLALRSGKQFTVRAVSGLDNIDRRAGEVKLLGQLATLVCAAGQPLWYTSESLDIPPQIEGTLHEYLDRSHSRLVGVIPLYPEQDPEPTTGSGAVPQRSQAVGVLIVEKIGDDRQGDGFVERVNAVALHSASALANALQHDSLFLLSLWQAIGRASWVVRARTLPKTLLAIAAVTAVVFGLLLIRADFDLSARGKLQPAIRSDIFAQIDGVVVDAPVRHEQMVEANQLLAKMTNNELEIEIANLIGRKQTTQERITSVQRSQLTDRRLTVEERNRLDGELLELRQVEESIDRELQLQLQKQEQLLVRSDRAGQVVTWNVHDLLLRRPVDKGQVLMTVVDPSGPWELELYMPERRMGHVSQATSEFADGLRVTFLLASHPGEFEGRVIEVQRTAEVRGDDGNAVVLRVAINKDELPELRSDTSVTARVHCGRRSVGYVWFHEVLETIQKKVLFWL